MCRPCPVSLCLTGCGYRLCGNTGHAEYDRLSMSNAGRLDYMGVGSFQRQCRVNRRSYIQFADTNYSTRIAEDTSGTPTPLTTLASMISSMGISLNRETTW